jgi:FAD/FMN-containing dehydrogenase
MSTTGTAEIAGFRGELLRPDDPGYDEARRLWNAAIDKRPAVIARCTDATDVAAGIGHARSTGLPLAVRGGGHNVAGTASCDGGIVLDLSPMKEVRVDPAGRTAWAQPGLLWGELDRATQAAGLATTGGIVTHTGVAGLTLGGGIGWLMRKHGLTCDNLLGVELVSADGRLLRADEREHPELYWGVRGGGGNFGVVTSFGFRLHQVGPLVLAGSVLYPAEQAGEVLRRYRDWAGDAPDQVSTVVNLRMAPPLPAIPERLHGVPVVTVVCCYAGPEPAEGQRLLEPLRRLGTPLLDLVTAKSYSEHQATFDATVPHGMHYYWKSHYLNELGDGAIDVLADQAWSHRSPLSYTIMFQLGGAVARVPDEATAFGGRGAAYALNINAAASDTQEYAGQADWARRLWEAMTPFANGVYMNFLGAEGHDRVRAAYGEQKYARLLALKRAWDPDNLFRLNQNIPPDQPTNRGG